MHNKEEILATRRVTPELLRLPSCRLTRILPVRGLRLAAGQ